MMTLLAWIVLGLTLMLNAALAWRLGRTGRSRWLIFGMYSLAFGVMLLVVNLALVGIARLVPIIDVRTVQLRLPIGLGLFWSVAVVGVWARLRRFDEKE